jgi:hypothetical protein
MNSERVVDLKTPPEASSNRIFSVNNCFLRENVHIAKKESLAYCFVAFLEVFSLKKGYAFFGIE